MEGAVVSSFPFTSSHRVILFVATSLFTLFCFCLLPRKTLKKRHIQPNWDLLNNRQDANFWRKQDKKNWVFLLRSRCQPGVRQLETTPCQTMQPRPAVRNWRESESIARSNGINNTPDYGYGKISPTLLLSMITETKGMLSALFCRQTCCSREQNKNVHDKTLLLLATLA